MFLLLRLIPMLMAFAFVVEVSAATMIRPTQRALVIGNSAYAVQPLTNPGRDAELIARTLEELGFTVTRATDLGRQQMFDTVRAFYAALPEASVALVFYAGHGMQIGGTNFLLPVDVVPTSEQGIRMRAYPLGNLLEHAKSSRAAVNLVVLDACRNNPFLGTRSSRTRGFSDMGLARVVSPQGTLLAYSTAPGHLAEDGAGRANSLYAEALAAELRRPGRTVEEVLKAVAANVRRATLDDQQPWFETSLVDDFYFAPPPNVAMLTRAPSRGGSSQVATGRGRNAVAEQHWYDDLDERGWQTLDWEISQRVRRMTREEVSLLEYRAEGGNLVAQTTLGIVLRDGLDRIVDPGTGRTLRMNGNNTQALKWLRRAAEAEFPVAQVELGEMYYQAHGVDRDLQMAAHWLEKAAAHPYPRARLDLAQLRVESDPSPESLQGLARELLKPHGLPAQWLPAQ